MKEVLKKKTKKPKFYQPDSDESESQSDEIMEYKKPKSKSKAKIAEMEAKHKALEDQFETMKKGLIESSTKKPETNNHQTDIDILRKKMILKF